MKRITVSFLLLFVFAIVSSPADASRTSLWELESIETWLQGDFRGTGLTSDGSVQPTVSTDRTQLPARVAWETERLDGTRIVGTSFPAALFAVDEDGEPTEITQTEDLGFTALGKVDGRVYAAATPSGDLYRVHPTGDSVTKVTTLPDSYVWTMTPDREGNGLYVGTGPDGNLYHLNSEGNAEKTATLPASNIMSMTFYDGSLHLGTDAGGLHKLDDNNEPRSVYGFGSGEVSSLSGTEEYLYASVNQRQGSQRQKNEQRSNSQLAEQLKQQQLEGRSRTPHETGETPDARPQESPSRAMMIQQIRQQTQNQSSGLFAGLSGSLVYRMKPPERMNVVYSDQEEIVQDLETDGEDLFVATSGNGRLYKIRPDFTRIAYFKADEQLLLDVDLDDGTLETITTGEGGSVHRATAFNDDHVTYRSSPMDAHLLARWGKLETISNGNIRLRTRSGNTPNPDTSWAEWSSWQTPPTFEVASDPARYLQLEVKFLDEASRLSKIDVSFQVPNQRPRIAELSVSPNPVTARFVRQQETGEEDNSRSSSPSRNGGHSVESQSIKKRTVNWKIVDPDGDPTKSRLFYRPLDGGKWISFTGEKYIKKQEHTIDLRNLSDGRYRLKLVTTDKFFNDPDYGFTTEKKSSPLLVDNTQPEFDSLELTGDRVRFTGVDETSRIMLAQYRLNGDPWRTVWPEDRIFDEKRETFSIPLPDRAESGDTLEFRLLDEGGNQALSRRTVP